MTQKRTGHFLAIDQDGKHYKIIEYTTLLDDSQFGSPGKGMTGLKSYKLDNGTQVRRRSDTEFEASLSNGSIIKLNILP